METARILRVVPLFAGATDAQLKAVSKVARLRRLKPGETVIREGEPGTSVYILKSGSVSVAMSRRDDEAQVLAKLVPCDLFGEMAILDHTPRSATVTASEETEVLEIPEPDLRRVLDADPDLALRVHRALAVIFCARLRAANEKLLAWSSLPPEHGA
ncbi:MAG: cyclic nucleotide-binding domain-containing protein [Nitrospirae bacterium]|nr:cyclic nucleotide-binding domain-containing protein [Nitrospirota bacterium]